jgi:hypothetical protein
MRIILVCLQFKYCNWLDNKKSILKETARGREREVMAKYETVVLRHKKKLSESGFAFLHGVVVVDERSTMRKKSRGECSEKKEMKKRTLRTER